MNQMHPFGRPLKGEFESHEPFLWSDMGPERGPKPRLKIWESEDEEILKWRNKHKGETCCIIANGPSVLDHDLSKINCTTISLNRAWKLRKWTYYCMGDREQFPEYEEQTGRSIETLKPLFCLGGGPKHALRVEALLHKTKKFSFDLTKGVYCNNTITSYGIHLTRWMGFKKVYIVGLDLNGGHFDGSRETPVHSFANQRETFGYIAGLLEGLNDPMEIINLNPKSWCFAFPKEYFKSIFG